MCKCGDEAQGKRIEELWDLKNCPFCGGNPKITGGSEEWSPTFYDPDSGGDPYSIKCQDCDGGFTHESFEIEDVVKKWNTRYILEQQEKELIESFRNNKKSVPLKRYKLTPVDTKLVR